MRSAHSYRLVFWFAAAVLGLAGGCRATQPGMDGHILSARDDPYGNPQDGFTDDEIRDRQAVVTDANIRAIAEDLSRIDFTLSTFQSSRFQIEAESVRAFDPGSISVRASASDQPVPPLHISTRALRSDWARLCSHPVWSTYFPPQPASGPGDDPCDPLNDLDQVEWALDDIDVSVTFGGVPTRWRPAEARLSGCSGLLCSELPGADTSAVLTLSFTMKVDPDPDDLLGTLLDIKDGFIDGEIRVQILPCPDGVCIAPGSTDLFAASYLGEGEAGDLTIPDPGFNILVRSRLVRGDMRVEPTPGCELLWAAAAPAIQHALGPFVPAGAQDILGIATTPGTLTTACSELANFVEDTQLRPALTRIASQVGGLVFASTMSASFARDCTGTPERCFRAEQVAALCAITDDARSEENQELPVCRFLRSREDADEILDRGLQVVNLAASEVEVPTSDGEVERMPLGARSARGDGFVAALSESDADADSALASIQIGAGVNAFMSCMTCDRDAPDGNCSYCDFCAECAARDAPSCAELCTALGPALELPTFASAAHRTPATHPLAIPTTEELWRVVDATPAIASYIRRVLARPFEARPGVTLRGARICPGSEGCPAGHFGALLLLRVDLDRDGIDDDADNCVGVENRSQANSDGDSFGDACDLCPQHRSDENLPTACDCDADEDGCNNDSISPDLQCNATHDDSYYDEDALHPSFVDDIDDDGRIGDCDDDDDSDGVLDDGAGDGIAVHTPCADGQTKNCDDSCRSLADSSQRDSDGDAVGDACEHLSDSICEKRVALCTWRSGPFDRFHLSGLAQRLLRLGNWGRGGPVFATLEKGGSLTVTGMSTDGSSRRLVGLGALGPLTGKALAALSFTETADFDGDLEADWAIGDPLGAEGRGRVVLVSSRDGSVLDVLVLEGPKTGFGASIASHAGRLYVGAPYARDATGEIVGAVIGFDLTTGARHAFTTYGTQPGAELGVSLVVAEGMNGPRIIAGAPGLGSGEEREVGGVVIIDGSGAGRAVVTGERARDRAGVSLAALDDGPKPRVAVGAPAASGGRGAVAILDLHGRVHGRVAGAATDALGASLVGLDQNGDGIDELVIGAPGRSSGAGGLVIVNEVGKELATAPGGPVGAQAGAALDTYDGPDRRGLVVSMPGIASSGASAWIALRAASM